MDTLVNYTRKMFIILTPVHLSRRIDAIQFYTFSCGLHYIPVLVSLGAGFALEEKAIDDIMAWSNLTKYVA